MNEQLSRFLDGGGFALDTLESLPGDLSQRHYFRVRRGAEPLLVAYYPPEMRVAQERFATAARLLAGAGVRVPEIVRDDLELGCMAVTDFGEHTLFDLARAGESLDERVDDAVVQSRRIAALDPAAVAALGSPPLDGALLRRELGATFEFVFVPRGLAALREAGERFREAVLGLCDRLGGEPLVPCHRDFMARNLMPVPRGVAVIDFQDLRLGPPAYDAASLLNDSLFPAAAEEAALLRDALPEALPVESYARAVVQRTLKAAGTFARFAASGKARHLPLIAPTLTRAVPHLESLPETADAYAGVADWWRRRLLSEPFC